MNKICIIGLGWLGQPLADLFIAKNWQVCGTTRTLEKQKALAARQLSSVRFNLYDTHSNTIPARYFKGAALILNIPPGRSGFVAERFEVQMKGLIEHAFSQGLSQLIFVSTTAVYGSCKGIITRDTQTAPSSSSGFAHQTIENYIKEHFWQQSVIVRPSGLVGRQRHPALSLSAKDNISLGLNPINLIHQTDLLAILEKLVEGNIVEQSFNLSTLDHPSRQDYYTWCCRKMGIRAPGFSRDDRNENEVDGKVIDMKSELAVLGIDLKYSSAFDFPLPSVFS